ncbi:MFS transporter [Paraburkholderia tropica]|uniref:MFS transporter n=1 Tax=Paraburkholderia tropica TaxID=92647 RepID=UPI002AB1F9A1|nr:MFS transporter [Paraburkholderia tropica]
MDGDTVVTQEPGGTSMPLRQTARSILAGSIGNAVESFDWAIYTAFAIYFSRQFFPADNESVALMSSFAVFAVGFGMRPLGGWAAGWIADRFGRRSALSLTIVGMGGASLLIAALPTYQQIGLLAPILMTALRMLQGLSMGGEYGAATLFLIESAPPARRGFYGSFLFFSIAAGLLAASALGALLAMLLSAADMAAYGWRIPFVIGGCGSLYGFWMRHGLPETPAFVELRKAGRNRGRSVWWMWRHCRAAVLRLVGITLLGAFSFYLFVSFMPVYAIHHAGAAPADAFLASTIGIALFMIAQPFFGTLSDRIGRRPQLMVFALAYLLFLIPVVKTVGAGFWSILLAECFGLLAYGLYTSVAPAVMTEQFDAEVRGVGIGTVYNLVVAIFGGTTPLLMTALQRHDRTDWFLAYICVGAAISLFTYWRMPETAGKS